MEWGKKFPALAGEWEGVEGLWKRVWQKFPAWAGEWERKAALLERKGRGAALKLRFAGWEGRFVWRKCNFVGKERKRRGLEIALCMQGREGRGLESQSFSVEWGKKFPAWVGMWDGATGLWKKVAEDFPALAREWEGAAGLWMEEGLKNLLAGPVGTGGGGEND